MVGALIGILCAVRSARTATGRWFAVALQEPLGHVVDDIQPCAAQATKPSQDLVDKGAQVARQMAPRVALEVAPFSLFLVQVRAVFGEPDDVQPRLALC